MRSVLSAKFNSRRGLHLTGPRLQPWQYCGTISDGNVVNGDFLDEYSFVLAQQANKRN